MKKQTLLLIALLIFQNVFSQFFKDKDGVTKYDGYFTFYYNVNEDKIYLEIEKLNAEFLYVRSLSEGIGSNDIGLDRGQLGNGVVVYFKRAGNKILLIQPNQKYRALTSNDDERKSVQEAFAKSVLHGFVIKEQNKGVLERNNLYSRINERVCYSG